VLHPQKKTVITLKYVTQYSVCKWTSELEKGENSKI